MQTDVQVFAKPGHEPGGGGGLTRCLHGVEARCSDQKVMCIPIMYHGMSSIITCMDALKTPHTMHLVNEGAKLQDALAGVRESTATGKDRLRDDSRKG